MSTADTVERFSSFRYSSLLSLLKKLLMARTFGVLDSVCSGLGLAVDFGSGFVSELSSVLMSSLSFLRAGDFSGAQLLKLLSCVVLTCELPLIVLSCEQLLLVSIVSTLHF